MVPCTTIRRRENCAFKRGETQYIQNFAALRYGGTACAAFARSMDSLPYRRSTTNCTLSIGQSSPVRRVKLYNRNRVWVRKGISKKQKTKLISSTTSVTIRRAPQLTFRLAIEAPWTERPSKSSSSGQPPRPARSTTCRPRLHATLPLPQPRQHCFHWHCHH